METFDFELMPADLELGPMGEAGEQMSAGLIWLLILLVAITMGALLYLSLREERPHRKQL